MDEIIDSVTADHGGARRRRSAGLVLAPVRLLGALLVQAFRLGWWSARLPVRATTRTARVLGFKAVVLFVAGLFIGLLFAPVSGAELRARLRRRMNGGQLTDDELAEKVGFELAHAPRTWHLPQPEVAVLEGRVALTGQVPHARGREELERVAAAVAGVNGVDNQLVVADEASGE